ncbi:MAG TPA: hypothetical protein VI653_21010 [Steroidobacteraceae bacterium]
MFDFGPVSPELMAQAESDVDDVLSSATVALVTPEQLRIAMIAAYLRGGSWVAQQSIHRMNQLTGLPP